MFEKFEHIGLKVSDMDRSVAFYADVIGMKLVDRQKIGEVDLAFMELGGQQLELIAGAGSTGSVAGPIDHFGFTVRDIEAAKAHIVGRYPQAEFEHTRDLWDGLSCTFFRGPDGERLELFERPDWVQAQERQDGVDRLQR